MAYRARLKVRFGDIDHAGIVYYPRFLHYFHVAMEEFFADALGVDYDRVLNEQRVGFPAVHLEVDFRRPLRYGDTIEVEVAMEEVGASSVTWRYAVLRPGEVKPAATARVVTVALDMDRFEKRPVPDWLRRHAAEGG